MLNVNFFGRNLFFQTIAARFSAPTWKPANTVRPRHAAVTQIVRATATVTAAAAAGAADTVQHIPKAVALSDLSSGGATGASLCAIGLKDWITVSGLHLDTTWPGGTPDVHGWRRQRRLSRPRIRLSM